MKKPAIFLSLAFAAAVSACQQRARQQPDEWITGAGSGGATRDTVRNGRNYRYYGGSWYPIYAGRISPSTYQGGTAREIGSPGYVPGRMSSGASSGRSSGSGIRSGGFGSSAHSSGGS